MTFTTLLLSGVFLSFYFGIAAGYELAISDCPAEGVWPQTHANDEAIVLCNPLPEINVRSIQNITDLILPLPLKQKLIGMLASSLIKTRACNAQGKWGDEKGECPSAAGCWAKEHVELRDLTCGDKESDAGLCYPQCKAGYSGVGPVCWEQCPDGYSDMGVLCKNNGKSVINAKKHKCPLYDVCGLFTSCTECPVGYDNKGCLCTKNDNLYTKGSYGRGVGKLPDFKNCKEDATPVGPFCITYGCSKGFTSCGLLCTESKDKCINLLSTIAIDTTLTLTSVILTGWTSGLIANTIHFSSLRTLLELVLSPKCT